MTEKSANTSTATARLPKGPRKRQERRAQKLAAASEAERAKALHKLVTSGLLELRRRSNEEYNPRLELPIFPFVDRVLLEIRTLWGKAAEAEMRPLLTGAATEAMARVVDPAFYRMTLRTLARLQRDRSAFSG